MLLDMVASGLRNQKIHRGLLQLRALRQQMLDLRALEAR